MNHDLHSYFFNRKNRVEFVRRRPYKKNDNCHVEQKNWTHVRELLGYERLDAKSQVRMMNDLYKKLWNPLWNYFTPVMKLQEKTRVGGKVIKKYDKLKTPYDRVMDCGTLTCREMDKLKEQYGGLNPFHRKKELEKQLKWFFRKVVLQNSRDKK